MKWTDEGTRYDVGSRIRTKQIEKAIHVEDWPRARALIKSELKADANNHWLLARLGLTYYEQRRYRRALAYAKTALAIAPDCPLVLWDYAGCLDMLGREEEALLVFRKLVRRGVNRIAYGTCGEGVAWARSLIADCHYRIAKGHRDLGHIAEAKRAFKRHCALRSRGYSSIYSLRQVKQELRLLNEVRCSPAAGSHGSGMRP